MLGPGESMAMYHWEADQEDFLVVAGEALLIIEGEERPLRQWDFVHCPPNAAHTIGAGDWPCVVVAVGAREHEEGRTGAAIRSTRRPPGTAPARGNDGAQRGVRAPDPAAAGPLSRRLARRDFQQTSNVAGKCRRSRADPDLVQPSRS